MRVKTIQNSSFKATSNMRIILSLLFTTCLLLLFSCQKKAEVLPIAEPKLIKILADIHLAEAAFQNLSTSTKDTLAYQYYDQIYQIHEVEQESVDSCIAILNRNPDKFFEIYEKVQEFLVKGAAENLEKIPEKNR